MGGPIRCGINRRCRHVLDTLIRAVSVAKRHGCEHFVVAGDLFDTTKPLPQMVAAVQKILRGEFESTILVLGNHEHVSTEPGDHALAPLEPVAKIVEKPAVLLLPGVELFILPCIPESAEEWFSIEVTKLANGRRWNNRSRVLCFHLGVADEETAHFLKGAKDSIGAGEVLEICEEHHFDAVFAGNWHDQRVWENKIFQLGALAPTGFDNPGLNGYGGLGIYDSSTKKTELIEIPGPRFITVDLDGHGLEDVDEEMGHILFGRFACIPSDVAATKEWGQKLKDEGVVEEFILRLDKTVQEQAARRAAQEVRKASTLKEAIVKYVEKMDLPEDVDRQEVVRQAEKYLAG